MSSSTVNQISTIKTIQFAVWWSVSSLFTTPGFWVWYDHSLESAAFYVVKGSVLMIKRYLNVDSVHKNEGIPLKNIHITKLNVMKNNIKIICLIHTFWYYKFYK